MEGNVPEMPDIPVIFTADLVAVPRVVSPRLARPRPPPPKNSLPQLPSEEMLRRTSDGDVQNRSGSTSPREGDLGPSSSRTNRRPPPRRPPPPPPPGLDSPPDTPPPVRRVSSSELASSVTDPPKPPSPSGISTSEGHESTNSAPSLSQAAKGIPKTKSKGLFFRSRGSRIRSMTSGSDSGLAVAADSSADPSLASSPPKEAVAAQQSALPGGGESGDNPGIGGGRAMTDGTKTIDRESRRRFSRFVGGGSSKGGSMIVPPKSDPSFVAATPPGSTVSGGSGGSSGSSILGSGGTTFSSGGNNNNINNNNNSNKRTHKAVYAHLDAAFLGSPVGKDMRRELKPSDDQHRGLLLYLLSDTLMRSDGLLADLYLYLVFSNVVLMRRSGYDLHRDLTSLLLERETYFVLLWRVLRREVELCRDESVLFRGESPAMALMMDFLRIKGKPLVLELLYPIFHHVVSDYSEAITFEVEEHRVSSLSLLEQNRASMVHVLEVALRVLFSSADAWGSSVRLICRMLRCAIGPRYPHKVQLILLNTLFLRFLCAALMSPDRWGLTEDFEVTERAQRCFSLLAKLLLQLGTGLPFGIKEPHMVYFNGVVSQHSARVVEYVAALALPIENHGATATEEDIDAQVREQRDRFRLDEEARETYLTRFASCLRTVLPNLATAVAELAPYLPGDTQERGAVVVEATNLGSALSELLFTSPFPSEQYL